MNQADLEGVDQRKRLEKFKQETLAKYLTREARERLGSLRYAHPELAESVENMIMQSAISGRLRDVIDDKKLKELLVALSPQKEEKKIKFERKI